MKVKVNTASTTQVVSVGIQGPSGPSGITTLSSATDVDVTNLTDGSVLVYSTDSSKWNSTLMLEKQTMECGQY